MQSGDFRRCQSTNRSRPPDTQRAVVVSRRVSATMHKCATCGRAFTRRDHPYRNCILLIYSNKKNKKRFNVQHQKWLVYRKRAHRRNAYTRAANACHFIIQPLAGATIGRGVMNTHTNATNNTSSFFIHSSDPVKHSTIVRHQIGRKQASKCVHRSVTATKHQECDAVLSANGRQRALQRTLVSRPRGAMFGHKVDESDVLRLQSVRIEVVAAPLGVHVHGDPVFSRSIGVVGVAHDRGRVRVDDDIRQRVFGNDVVRAAHQRVAR